MKWPIAKNRNRVKRSLIPGDKMYSAIKSKAFKREVKGVGGGERGKRTPRGLFCIKIISRINVFTSINAHACTRDPLAVHHALAKADA